MITVILGLMTAAGGYCGVHYGLAWGVGWSVFVGIATFVLFQFVVGRKIQQRVKADMESVQSILLDGQKQLQAKMQRWQFRPPGSLQAMQLEVAADTKVFVKAAMDRTEVLRKYRFWVPMMNRQIATAQLQLSWMIKDFATVDKLMPQVLLIDPTMAAMKMARQYMLDAPTEEIQKVYRKAVRRTRYNGNVLLAATMSWIQVQRKDGDGACKTLAEALKKSDNETLKQNHLHLMNNRMTHFSNTGIGDTWYSLLLEEPRVHTQRQRSFYR